jgi:hypothetical protein
MGMGNNLSDKDLPTEVLSLSQVALWSPPRGFKMR